MLILLLTRKRTDFTDDFRMIERSLYDRDIETARVQFHNMEKKMFEVTE